MVASHAPATQAPVKELRAYAGVLAVVALALFAGGCASLGAPVERKAPVAAPITDLAAQQHGNDVVLTFSVPQQTVDGRPLTSTPAIEIYRSIQSTSQSAGGAAGAPAKRDAAPVLLVTIPSAMVSTYVQASRFRYVDSLTAGDFVAASSSVAAYIVRTRASVKKASADSNRAEVPVYPAPLAVADLQAHVTQSAVLLSWTAPQTTLAGAPPQIARYRIYRAQAQPAAPSSAAASESEPPLASPLVQIAESSTPEFRDDTAQADKTYGYSVRSVTQLSDKTLESSDSNIVVVTVHDVFPPSAPTQILIVPVPTEEGTLAHLDLSWAINPETDLAGYNVYRSEEAGVRGAKVNSDVLPTPAFRDMNGLPGRTYFYSVTALDRTGNESAASAAVAGRLPTQPAEGQPSP